MERDEISLGSEPDFRLGRLTVRPSASEVAWEGGARHIEPRAMQVLAALGRAGSQVVTRDELIRTCWGGNIVGDDAINRVVGRLRKLSVETEAGFVIETIPKIGYRLLVSEAAPDPGATVESPPSIPSETPDNVRLEAQASAEPPRRFDSQRPDWRRPDWRRLVGGRRWALVAGALLVVGLVAVGVKTMGLGGSSGAGRSIVVSRPVTLAVLPFESFDADPGSVLFADGISAELHHALAQSGPGPQLIGRASSAMFRGDAKRLDDMRERLGVTHIVDGTVERKGDRIRASVELVDAISGRKIWSDQMTADLSDVEIMLHRIVVHVREGLEVEAARAGEARPLDPRALDLYFSHSEVRQGDAYAEEQRATIAAMKTAVAIEPNFTRAWMKLADACVQYYSYAPTLELREEARATGKQAAKRLVELAPDDAEIWLLQARFEVDAKSVRALRKRAEELDPSNPRLLVAQSYQFSRVGRGRQALDVVERARVLDPLDERVLWALFKAQSVAGQPAQTEQELERTAPEIAVNVWPSIIMDWWVRGEPARARAAMAKFADAVAANARRPDMPAAMAQLSRRWSDEFVAFDAAMQGGAAARAALSKTLARRVFRVEGQFDERGAVYRQYLPMIALLSGVDEAMAAWAKRMEALPEDGGSAEADSQRRLESNAWRIMAFNGGFRPMHRDPRFWRFAALYTAVSEGAVPLKDWVGDDELWAPDFCSEPGFPYDCTAAAKAALAR